MPRNVRNFWLEADIEGRKATFTGGPQRADGGFVLTIFQRDKGSVTKAMEIRGFIDTNGRIRLNAGTFNPLDAMLTVITER